MLEYLKSEMVDRVKERGEKFSGTYAEYGFWSNPFHGGDSPLQAHFELFSGRKKELQELTRLVVDSLTGVGTDVAIVAPYGLGGRSVVNLLAHFLSTLDDEVPEFALLQERISSIIDTPAIAFSSDLRDTAKRNIMSALKKGKLTIMTTHFCGLPFFSVNAHNETTMETIRKLLEFDSMSSDKVIYLTPWNTTTWKYVSDESPMLKGVYEHVVELKPFTSAQIVQLLKKRISFYALEGKKHSMDDKILHLIATHSGGFPRFALEMAEQILDHAISQKKSLTQSAKHLLSHHPSYAVLSKRFHELIPPSRPWQKREHTLKRIIRAMILLGGSSLTATDVAGVVKKSRPAISRHLHMLEEQGIVKKEESLRDERRVPYSLVPFARAVYESEF